MIFSKRFILSMLGSALICAPALHAEDKTLTIESWRSEDAAIWKDKIIPAFEAANPGIKVKFTPTAPTEYNSALAAKLDGKTAGDLITCRPFDVSLDLFKKGNLASLNDIDELKNFPDFAKAAWSTDDGSDVFCIPMASVIHGFMYNKDIFKELNLSTPKTEDEFFTLLETIKKEGSYTPLAMGTLDQWEAATMGFQNVGPNYWKGEEGRLALLKGEQKLSDQPYVDTFKNLARWTPYLPEGFEAQGYADSQIMFTLGRAAIYPTGSWEIAGFQKDSDFELGAFYPPIQKEGDKCFISDHVDIGLGINTNSKNKDAAIAFVKWIGSADFAEIYANEVPGFFSLSTHEIAYKNPLAEEFVSWRKSCDSTIRNSYQILSRGTPSLENEIWRTSSGVINGKLSAEEAAKDLQKGLESWYTPKN